MRAAVPQYVGTSFNEAPPGHRFRLYFRGWDDTWDRHGKDRDRIVADTVALSRGVRASLDALLARQDALAVSGHTDVVSIDARTEAPFVTGIGMEHPLENGFAFLDPHGLPYLPGSSVKGVLRRAAEELALFATDPQGWSVAAVWWLFGFDAMAAYLRGDERNDPQPVRDERRAWREAYQRHIALTDLNLYDAFLRPYKEEMLDEPEFADLQHQWDIAAVLKRLPRSPACKRIHARGALETWDVYPQPAGGQLRVDIMNPHFGNYYQQAKPPSDDGNPTPIFFLAVPADSAFAFRVRLAPTSSLPGVLRQRWCDLVTSAFEHAFQWVGFGAKGGIGYGRMCRDVKAESRRESDRRTVEERRRTAHETERRAAEEEAQRKHLESLSPVERLALELSQCDEQRAHDVYAHELDKCAQGEQRRLATALKTAYERFGKWRGKQSAKQQQKIQKLKAILREP